MEYYLVDSKWTLKVDALTTLLKKVEKTLLNDFNYFEKIKLDDSDADDRGFDYGNDNETLEYKYYTNTRTNLKRAANTGLLSIK